VLKAKGEGIESYSKCMKLKTCSKKQEFASKLWFLLLKGHDAISHLDWLYVLDPMRIVLTFETEVVHVCKE
jgi:hypothetical protein